MQFIVEFETAHLLRAMEAVRMGVASKREMLGAVGEELLNVNQARHDQGLAPDGSKWKELAPLTLAEGDRKGGPLNKTGRMLRSLDYQVQGDALLLGFDGARDGKLAGIHHGGTDPYTITPKKAKALSFAGLAVKRVNHPGLAARPLLGFPESDRRLVGDVIEDHLTKVLRSARGG